MNTLSKITAVAALAAVSGVSAFAQSSLKADVPFAFSTPAGGHLPAGKYQVTAVSNMSGSPTYRLQNMNTGESVLALGSQVIQRPVGERAFKGTLLFRCSGDTCAIAGVYDRGSRYGYGVPAKVKPVAPATDIAEIRIPLAE